MTGQERLIYLWNGSEWVKVIGESVVNPNLRAKLYDGANGIDSTLGGTDIVAKRGLVTISAIEAYDLVSGFARLLTGQSLTDDIANGHRGLANLSFLLGFDGITWDRLRTDGLGVLKVSKGDISPTVAHPAAAGAVVAGVHKIFWIACTPDSPGSEWELSDDTDGSTVEIYCHFDTDRHSEHIDFNPPLEVSTGIYVKKFDKMKCLHICYA